MKVTDINTVDDIRSSLDDHHYIANRALATSIYLSLKMEKPIFVSSTDIRASLRVSKSYLLKL